jgi:hypothetical protein
MQIGWVPTEWSERRDKQKRKLDSLRSTFWTKMQVTRFSLVDFLYKNANRLRAYKEERAPRQVEKETRFSILCGQLSEQKCK